MVLGDRTELREGYAEVGDVRLHYVETGDGPLIVLLLLRDARPAYTPEDTERYIEAWSQPGAAAAMINYYRAAVRQSPKKAEAQLGPISAPTLVIWGQRDRYLGPELAEPDRDDVPGLDRVERLPDASHWVHHDEPEHVTQLLIDFFAQPAPPNPAKNSNSSGPATVRAERTRDMSAADRFSELRQQVDQAESDIKAAASEDSAKLKAKADEARKAADEHAGQFAAMAQDTSEQAEAHWNELQSSWDQHIQRIRQRITEKKSELDAASAQRDAEWAENDAVNAVDFALVAVQEAEYAVLDAAVTRANAEAMASS
jgi:hypothetical protein